MGAVLCNTGLIKRSFLLVLPFFFPDPAHVYFSFSFYFFLFIQLWFLLFLHFINPHHRLPGKLVGDGGTWPILFGFLFLFKINWLDIVTFPPVSLLHNTELHYL